MMLNKKSYNLEYLNELADEDEGFVQDMVKYFIDNSLGTTQRMKGYYELKDYVELRNEAHKFSSNLNMMGLTEAIENVEKIEDCAVKSVNLEQVPELINGIEKICKIAVNELKRDFN